MDTISYCMDAVALAVPQTEREILRMSSEPENLEWSLPVPDVKELVIQGLETVPPQYIRDDVDHPVAARFDPSFCIPLIDMAKLVNPECQEMELHKLHAACKNWGAFQLINHGISDESLRNMKNKTKDFFNLPLQEKKRYAHKPGSLEGYGQAFVISEEQKLEWCDMIFLKTLPPHIRSPGFWPEQPQKYRETIETYSEEMKEIAVSLLKFIAMNLGLEPKQFSEAFRDGNCELRMNCYPPCPEPGRVIGLTSHTDVQAMAFLVECGETPGLQVLKDGHWVFVEPIADAILVNMGNIVEIMSNGIYKAPFHRAVVNQLKERLSIDIFCSPSASVDIAPAGELIKAGTPAKYKTLTPEEYLQSFFNWNFDPIPFIDTLKL